MVRAISYKYKWLRGLDVNWNKLYQLCLQGDGRKVGEWFGNCVKKGGSMSVKVEQKQIPVDEIKHYLMVNKSLTSINNISEFSKKICEKAVHFCIYDGGILMGFMACYFNHPAKLFGFITTISVGKSYQNIGLGGSLLKASIEYAVKNKFEKLRLEVNVENLIAIRLYEKFGFAKIETLKNSLILETVIKNPMF